VQRIPSGPEAPQPQQQAGYMYATFLTCTLNFFLATRDGPYMSPESSDACRSLRFSAQAEQALWLPRICGERRFSSSTPIISRPPAVLANATSDLRIGLGEDAPRLNSSVLPSSRAIKSVMELLILYSLFKSIIHAFPHGVKTLRKKLFYPPHLIPR